MGFKKHVNSCVNGEIIAVDLHDVIFFIVFASIIHLRIYKT